MKIIPALLIFHLLAFTPSTESKPSLQSDSIQSSSPIEILLLKDQNQNLKQHNSELLNVLLWSLGFTAVFLIGFFGLFGYITTRRYDQEKKSLEIELRAEIASKSTLMEKQLNEKMTLNAEKIEATFKESSQEIRQVVEATIAASVRSLDRSIENVKSDIADLKLSRIQTEAEKWDAMKVPANSIVSWRQFCQEAHSMGHDWRVANGLEKILQHLAAGARFTTSDLPGVNGFLLSLPPMHSPLVTKIKTYL